MIVHGILSWVRYVALMTPQSRTLLHSPAFCKPLLAASTPSSNLEPKCFGTVALADIQNHINISTSPKLKYIASSTRVSRTAKIEVQDALFEYLHSTRGVSFTDAEHISKNSPNFVLKLLSKANDRIEVRKSMTKFLRYHPINEFEPFLESLGLKPSQISSVIPRDKMFLTDDRVLLENYRVLCYYGIPRMKIGKVYKEAKEAFGYSSGELSQKLRGYEEMGLSQCAVAKLVGFSPSLLVGDANVHFAEVFEKLKEWGIWDKFIGGYLPEVRRFEWKRILDTMEALGGVGYTEKQIESLFEQNLSLLLDCSGKRLSILINELVKLGITTDQVSLLCRENPQVSSRTFACNVLQALSFLSGIGMGANDIEVIISTHFRLMGFHSLKQPKVVLCHLGIGFKKMCQMLKKDPQKLFSLMSKPKSQVHSAVACQDLGKHQEKIAFLVRLGYDVNSDEMAKAVKRFRGRGDKLQERFDCLVQAGLDSEVVVNMIKQFPDLVNQQKDVIEKKVQCLMNTLGYPLESIVSFPSYLGYGLDRINLRFAMYTWLKKQNAIESTLSLSSILASSERRFVKYFVDVHPEGPAMYENLKHSLVSS